MATDRLLMQLKDLQGIGKFAPMAVATVAAQRASQLAPRDTGYMADHVHAEQEGKQAFVVSEASYSVHVEFGTYKMAAQPFMRPAIDASKTNLLRTAGDAVMTEIRRLIR